MPNVQKVQLSFNLIAALISLWLLSSLYFVNLDFDDGYATIVNAQYLLGITPEYFMQRGPAMAVALMPAEWLASALGLHPLNVRPHHATMVLLHLIYLLGSWVLLTREHDRSWPVLLAYVAAIPSFLFFSYAPFISHDIFPGLLLLLMLWGANKYTQTSRSAWLIALVMLGTLSALIKQSFALFWVATLVAVATTLVIERRPLREAVRCVFLLFSSAALSGAITWCLYAWILASSFPAVPYIWRPWAQAVLISEYFGQAGPISEMFYWWVYLRNLPAYGVLTMALIIPGLVLSLGAGSRLQRMIAIAWIVLVACMHCIDFKEVRYLGMLAPLTAFLIVPAITAVIQIRRSYAAILLAVLAFDFVGVTREAARIGDPYYANEVTHFLEPLPSVNAAHTKVVLAGALSFVSPEPYAFYGDRFHRITNLVDVAVRNLYGYQRATADMLPSGAALEPPQISEGTWVFFVNQIATRVPPFSAQRRSGLDQHFSQILSRAEWITLRRDGARYWMTEPGAEAVLLMPLPAAAREQPLIETTSFDANSLKRMRQISGDPSRIRVLGFRIKRYCNLAGCGQG